MEDATVFTALDARLGYWQFLVRKQDRDKTAFVCYSGSYRFNQMPFELANAPVAFQQAGDILMNLFKWLTCFLYLDDSYNFV